MRPRSVLLLALASVATVLPGLAQVPANPLPLRIGASQTGGNGFRGEIAAVRLYDRVLDAAEITRLAAAKPAAGAGLPGLTGEWIFSGHGDSLLSNASGASATANGAIKAAARGDVACARFDGGWFEVPDQPKFALSKGFSAEVWIHPEAGMDGRIIDKITPGGTDGFLLDTNPGTGIRLIVGADILTVPYAAMGWQASPSAAWLHLVASVDGGGNLALHANGKRVAGSTAEEGIEFSDPATGPGKPLTLWYQAPAKRWVEASVIGNGRLGGMVWGGVGLERIDLNEDTLWSGEPYDNLNPKGLQALPEIRKQLLAGNNDEAQRLVEQNMNGKFNESYQPLGNLTIKFPFADEVSGYRRDLDLEQGIARVQFVHEGTRFTRETFASFPDQAIIVRLQADKPGQTSFTATLDSLLHHQLGADPACLRLSGRAPFHADSYGNKEVVYEDAAEGRGMRFEVRLAAVNEGGKLSITGQGITAENCDAVTLLLVAATSYNGPHKSPSKDGKNPAQLCENVLKQLDQRPFAALREAHVADHARLFGRVALDLGHGPGEALPTAVRLRQYQSSNDPGLAALYYQFGRYLLIASSRPGSQPANLQGIWNPYVNPPWAANWTLNCNAQINYWSVETANLAECHEPLLALTAELVVDGAHIASQLYGARGWVAHHNTDIWRQAGPVAGNAIWTMFPVGSAWLTQHLWEHYAFSGDQEDLRRAWPVLAGAARFYLDYLMEEPRHRWLVTGPDTNFENSFRKPNGETGCTCMGATASLQMIRELFKNCIAACRVLDTDAALGAELERALPRLAPMQISPTTGELQEWLEDWQRTADCQVLSSWGAVCSAQITPRGTPELAAALRMIFDKAQWWKHGAVGSWQGAFQANVYARLHDGDTAFDVVQTHLRSSLNPNLLARFGGYCDFEIDGNLGQTAAIGEMLLQSHAGEIELLPALPKAWPNGSVKGLRARGGCEVDIQWQDGKVRDYTIRAVSPRQIDVRVNGEVRRITPLGK